MLKVIQMSRKKNFWFVFAVVIILFPFFSLSSAINADAQIPKLQWTQTYPTGWFGGINSMIQTTDGGYALAGNILDPDGLGRSNGPRLIKTNATGDIEWDYSYLGSGSAFSVIQTKDGGYVMAGSDGGQGSCLIKTDSSGKLEWNQTYDEHAYFVIQTNDGGFALAGYTSAFSGTTDFLLVKTDAIGNIQWKQVFSEKGNQVITSITQTSQGGYTLAGYTLPDYSGCIVNTDPSGNLQWIRTVEGILFSIVQTNDEGYAFVGNTFYPSESDDDAIVTAGFLLAKTDIIGEMVLNRTYNQIQVEKSDLRWWGARDVIQTTDEGYALAGNSSMIKTDDAGEVQWSQTLNGTAVSLVQTSDGDYTVAGSNWLIKIKIIEVISPSPTIPEFMPVTLLVLAVIVCVVVAVLKRRLRFAR
jgi:hypothetical protein